MVKRARAGRALVDGAVGPLDAARARHDFVALEGGGVLGPRGAHDHALPYPRRVLEGPCAARAARVGIVDAAARCLRAKVVRRGAARCGAARRGGPV